VRVIEYSVSTEDGKDTSEVFCLVTDLIDPPSSVRCKPRRRTGSAGDRDRVRRAGDRHPRRTRSGASLEVPDMIRQELYAALCVYQAIRTLICTSAQEAGLDPDRISFTCAKNAIAARVSDAAAFSPR